MCSQVLYRGKSSVAVKNNLFKLFGLERVKFEYNVSFACLVLTMGFALFQMEEVHVTGVHS